MTLIYISGAWVLGIFLGSLFYLPPAMALIGLIPPALLILFRNKGKTLVLTGLCLAILFTGVYRYHIAAYDANEQALSRYNDSGTVEIQGTISDEPEVRDKATQLRLYAARVKRNGDWQATSGSILLLVPRYPAYKYGDMLQIKGKLETPPRLGDFDYQVYLAHQGIYSTMLYPHIDVIGRDASQPLEWLFSLRERLSAVLSAVLPEPQASLASGIVLGIRSTISSSLKTDLSRTGTAHLLAISGLNLGIIAGVMVAAGLWLFGRRRYIYAWLTLFVIWLYSVLTGLEPPVVRSAIMATMFLLAELLGRQRSAMTALAFAAAVMIGITPQVLWAASFQLSFLAMAGLVFIAPPLRALGKNAIHVHIGEEGTLVRLACLTSDSIAVTLGALIAVSPLIAYYFGIISVVGTLATLMTAPALPGVIVTGALASFLGLSSLTLAYVVGWFAWLFLSYMLILVTGFAILPLSYAEVAMPDGRLVWGYYAILALVVWLVANKKKLAGLASGTASRLKPATGSIGGVRMKWAVPPLLAIVVLISASIAVIPDDNLHVSILDVGQGDAILVHRGNQQVLIDGGPSPQAVCLGLGNRMPFWDRTIELIVLTHPHADHLTGLVEVLRRYKVEQVLLSGMPSDSPVYGEYLSLLKERGVKSTIAHAGQRLELGRATAIDVLSPESLLSSGKESDIDNNAVVLRLSLDRVSFLFTSDIGRETELNLLSQRSGLSSTVLKVAHHGSATSTSDEFLAVANPQAAAISVGAGNRFGHPSRETVTRLGGKLDDRQIYRTDERGTVEFITDGKRLWVKTER